MVTVKLREAISGGKLERVLVEEARKNSINPRSEDYFWYERQRKKRESVNVRAHGGQMRLCTPEFFYSEGHSPADELGPDEIYRRTDIILEAKLHKTIRPDLDLPPVIMGAIAEGYIPDIKIGEFEDSFSIFWGEGNMKVSHPGFMYPVNGICLMPGWTSTTFSEAEIKDKFEKYISCVKLAVGEPLNCN